MKLLDKIQSNRATLTVMGMGYVGLPLALEFSKVFPKVHGFDPDQIKIKALRQGRSYIRDIPPAAVRQGLIRGFRPVSDAKVLGASDVIVICVPTPLNEYKTPDMAYIRAAMQTVLKQVRKQTLVVLESTTYPGSTDEEVIACLETQKNFKLGRDFYAGFSPERIDPGNQKFMLKNTPKVIGGAEPQSQKLLQALYAKVCDVVVPVSHPRTAEMTKLLENIFRNVNIALINEFALLCNRMDIDVWEVIEAAKTKPYGFMPFYPGPGLGGHCIPLDPFYLSHRAKKFGFITRFIELAGEVNDSMPSFMVTKVTYALNSVSRSVRGSKILVLGVAYKKDVNDARETSARPIMAGLLKKGARVFYADPYIARFSVAGQSLRSVSTRGLNYAGFDLVLVHTHHSGMDYEKLYRSKTLIVDTRNVFKGRKRRGLFRL